MQNFKIHNDNSDKSRSFYQQLLYYSILRICKENEIKKPIAHIEYMYIQSY